MTPILPVRCPVCGALPDTPCVEYHPYYDKVLPRKLHPLRQQIVDGELTEADAYQQWAQTLLERQIRREDLIKKELQISQDNARVEEARRAAEKDAAVRWAKECAAQRVAREAMIEKPDATREYVRKKEQSRIEAWSAHRAREKARQKATAVRQRTQKDAERRRVLASWETEIREKKKAVRSVAPSYGEAWSVACPRCAAKSSVACLGPLGQPLQHPHDERRSVIEDQRRQRILWDRAVRQAVCDDPRYTDSLVPDMRCTHRPSEANCPEATPPRLWDSPLFDDRRVDDLFAHVDLSWWHRVTPEERERRYWADPVEAARRRRAWLVSQQDAGKKVPKRLDGGSRLAHWVQTTRRISTDVEGLGGFAPSTGLTVAYQLPLWAVDGGYRWPAHQP